MPVAKLIAPTTKQEIPKLRVAAYCRVSSNSADQRNSFATQERVYTKYIATVYKGNIIKNLIMDCQSYTKYRPNETISP